LHFRALFTELLFGYCESMSDDAVGGGSEVLHWGDNECEAFVERELAGEDHRAPVTVPFCQPRFRMDCHKIEPDSFRMKRAYNGFSLGHGLWQMFM
jgi:hypothetical protein